MAEIEKVDPRSTVESAVSRAMRGGMNERHRLCYDFNDIGGLKQFFANTKKAGICHPDAVPVLIHSQPNETVWLVGFKKPKTIAETLPDV